MTELPLATIIDATLGVLTLAAVALAVFGLRRAPRWVERRWRWPAWRFGLRLLPQLVAPIVAIFVFTVLPVLDGNSATTLDAFGLWPALMILLATTALTGVLLIVGRLLERHPKHT